MRFSRSEKQRYVAQNRDEYGALSDRLSFIDGAEAMRLEAARRELLADIVRLGATDDFNGTKIDGRELSPGCRACGEGSWNCLFINGKCNARCFYCPAEQNDKGEPTTNLTTFSYPDEWAEYLLNDGFTGASVSGGEPLLTFDRTLRFIRAARLLCGDDIHLWMYTNGILIDEEKLTALRDAGLSEIRFDIGAVGYAVEKAALAARYIGRVTIEIPAVPSEEERLTALVRELAAAGVRHLNLHQLRMTPYSAERFIERGIVLRHGPKVLAAHSEMTALRVLRETLRSGIVLPINYCSFLFKNTFQTRAARLRNAAVLGVMPEDITATGLIRDRAGDTVSYHTAQTRSQVSFAHPFKEVRLSSGKKIVVEKMPFGEPLTLSADEKRFLERLIALPPAVAAALEDELVERDDARLLSLYRAEVLSQGFLEYF